MILNCAVEFEVGPYFVSTVLKEYESVVSKGLTCVVEVEIGLGNIVTVSIGKTYFE